MTAIVWGWKGEARIAGCILKCDSSTRYEVQDPAPEESGPIRGSMAGADCGAAVVGGRADPGGGPVGGPADYRGARRAPRAGLDGA